MDYTVCGILQARILEWVAISFSRNLPHPGIEPRSPALQVDSLLTEPSEKRPKCKWWRIKRSVKDFPGGSPFTTEKKKQMTEALMTGIKEEVFSLNKSRDSQLSSLKTFLISIPVSLQVSKQIAT